MTPDLQPIHTGELSAIQLMQHLDLEQAQDRAAMWLREKLGINATRVTLRPQATSLNSFNGIAVIDGKEQFFKSHTEPDGTISEYYNAGILEDAGYNVVRPLRVEQRAGQQIAFYPVIQSAVMFDIMRAAEQSDSATAAQAMVALETCECSKLLEIYRGTAGTSTPEQHAEAPIHQLFWRRLTGARFSRFYGSRPIATVDGAPVKMHDLLSMNWTINGIAQPRTLGELIAEATTVLNPAQAGLTVIGHGDAHYGNVFLDEQDRFLYFDPAFAGRHSPFLDIAKPLFHNVFAQWLYFPTEYKERISVRIANGRVEVTYQDIFTELRRDLLHVKLDGIVGPTAKWLSVANALPHGRRPLELALMCCPLLTMDLTDKDRFPVPVNWLGLALAVQMGNWDLDQEFAFP